MMPYSPPKYIAVCTSRYGIHKERIVDGRRSVEKGSTLRDGALGAVSVGRFKQLVRSFVRFCCWLLLCVVAPSSQLSDTPKSFDHSFIHSPVRSLVCFIIRPIVVQQRLRPHLLTWQAEFVRAFRCFAGQIDDGCSNDDGRGLRKACPSFDSHGQ